MIIAWEDIAQARLQTNYITGEPIFAFHHTISTGEFDDSPAVREELRLWNMVNPGSLILQKLRVDLVIMVPYFVILLSGMGSRIDRF